MNFVIILYLNWDVDRMLVFLFEWFLRLYSIHPIQIERNYAVFTFFTIQNTFVIWIKVLTIQVTFRVTFIVSLFKIQGKFGVRASLLESYLIVEWESHFTFRQSTVYFLAIVKDEALKRADLVIGRQSSVHNSFLIGHLFKNQVMFNIGRS